VTLIYWAKNNLTRKVLENSTKPSRNDKVHDKKSSKTVSAT